MRSNYSVHALHNVTLPGYTIGQTVNITIVIGVVSYGRMH
jgi:hypothetical protein